MIDVTNVVMVILAVLLIASIAMFGYAVVEKGKDSYCAFCKNEISENADIVYCSDGRHFHAECYLQYIRESENDETE